MQTDDQPGDRAAVKTDRQAVTVNVPVLTYTHRVVGYEVRCSLPWTDAGAVVARDEAYADAAVTGVGDGSARPLYVVVPCSMSVAACVASFPRGSVLYVQAPVAQERYQLAQWCAALRSAGFLHGIAEYGGEAYWDDILPLMSHVRFSGTRGLSHRQKDLLGSSLRRRVTFVASGIETQGDLGRAMQVGFQLFQGNFAYRIPRLKLSEQELLKRLLLLKKVCASADMNLDVLTEFLGWAALAERLDTLLRQAAPDLRASVEHPSHLLEVLGGGCARQAVLISLMRDLTGSSSQVLLRRLFHVARLHELMRVSASRSAAGVACFEGMVLSALQAQETIEGEPGLAEHTGAMLRDKLGTPMNCSAFAKNQAIADAYEAAKWEELEQRCRQDGYAFIAVDRLFQDAAAWALRYADLERCFRRQTGAG